MQKLPFVILCVSTSLSLLVITPAAADVAEDIAEQMEDVRTHEIARRVKSKEIHSAPPGQVLAELRKYVSDPSKRVRSEALSLAWGIGEGHPARGIRQQAVKLIFDIGLTDSDSANALRAAEKLLDFSAADFTDEMKQVIHRLLYEKIPENIPHLMLLAGVADVRSAEGHLRELAGKGFGAARMALARMGDKAAIQAVIAKVEAEPDPFRKIASLLGSLAYLRQPEAVEVLVQYLFSDEKLPGSFDVPSSPYAGYALDQLKEIIEGFPKLYKPGDSGDDEIAKARSWITQQGGASKLKIKR